MFAILPVVLTSAEAILTVTIRHTGLPQKAMQLLRKIIKAVIWAAAEQPRTLNLHPMLGSVPTVTAE